MTNRTFAAADPERPVTLGGTRCPVCASVTRCEAPLRELALHRCPACGCWSSDALVRGASTSFEPEAYFASADADRERWRELLQTAGTISAGAPAILDVGCGTGAFLGLCRESAPQTQLTGIELDPGRAKRATERVANARILTGDAVAVSESLTGHFDLITLWDVFEHVPEPTRLLTALAKRLSPGGRLYVQTIHEDSILPRLGRLSYRLSGGKLQAAIRRTHDAHHLVFFSRRGLAHAAAAANLRIEREWFGRLARARMDGHPLVTLTAAALLWAENRWGNGLFVNALMVRPAPNP